MTTVPADRAAKQHGVTPGSSAAHYAALDGLRAISVIIVMLAHAEFPYPRDGAVGVEIFFVLSGFLITGILSREFERTGRIDRKNFYMRRLLRLMPCLVLTLILFSVFFVIQKHHFPTGIVAVCLTYTSNWARPYWDLDGMAHSWSLGVEQQYYLVWPFVILLLERACRSSLVKFWSLACLALSIALYRAAFVGTYSEARLYVGTDTHMDGLVLGSALSYLVTSLRASGHEFSRELRFVSRLVVPAAILGLLVVMYLIGGPWMGRLGYWLTAVAAFFIVGDLVLSPYSYMRRALSWAPLVYLGTISYGLYLFHYPLYGIIDRYVSHVGYGPKLALKLSLCVLVAALSYHLVEVRFLRLKNLFGTSKRTERSSSQAPVA